jgi:integrase/recombinase XerD
MLNRVTFSVIARDHGAKDSVSLNAQCFVNGQRTVIPLSIYVDRKLFDSSKELVKPMCPQAIDYNSIIANARERVTTILAQANRANIRLDRKGFRARFSLTLSEQDFVSFWESELESRRGVIEASTYKQQEASLKKFKSFKSCVPFDILCHDLVESYDRFLGRKNNNINTRAQALKNMKTYVNMAIKKGVEIKNPFRYFKIKQVEGPIVFLHLPELKKLLSMYDMDEVADHLKESLLVFMVQSFTSIRISDVKIINESWIHYGQLEFTPYKTRKKLKVVRYGLSKIAVRLLKDLFELKKKKPLKSEQKINDDLKLIAAFAGIKKRVTTHVARHTFATTYLTLGGTVEVLQQIMGHARIETTMRYVHVIDERKTQQMGNFDTEFK